MTGVQTCALPIWVRRSSPHLLRPTFGPVSPSAPGSPEVLSVAAGLASDLAVVAAEGLSVASPEGGGPAGPVRSVELETGAADLGGAVSVSPAVEVGVTEGLSTPTVTPPSPVRPSRMESELVSSSPLLAQGVAGPGSAPTSSLPTYALAMPASPAPVGGSVVQRICGNVWFG